MEFQLNEFLNLVNDAHSNILKLLLSFKHRAMLKGSYSNHRFLKSKKKRRKKLIIKDIKPMNLVKEANTCGLKHLLSFTFYCARFKGSYSNQKIKKEIYQKKKKKKKVKHQNHQGDESWPMEINLRISL